MFQDRSVETALAEHEILDLLFIQTFFRLWLTCSSFVSSTSRPSLKLVAGCHSPICGSTMSDQKRKATSAAKEPVGKRQKLAPTKEEKKEKDGGWLLEVVEQQRTENKEMSFNTKRLRFISDTKKIKQGSEGVLYWMLRDHRVQGERPEVRSLPVSSVSVCSDRFCLLDNWALIHAQQLALKEKLPLHVCVCLHVPKSELSTLRHYCFMLKGLEEVAEVRKDCAEKTSSSVCVQTFLLPLSHRNAKP